MMLSLIEGVPIAVRIPVKDQLMPCILKITYPAEVEEGCPNDGTIKIFASIDNEIPDSLHCEIGKICGRPDKMRLTDKKMKKKKSRIFLNNYCYLSLCTDSSKGCNVILTCSF